MPNQAGTTPVATRYAELFELVNLSRAAPKVGQGTPEVASAVGGMAMGFKGHAACSGNFLWNLSKSESGAEYAE